jgi:hypothetical protein
VVAKAIERLVEAAPKQAPIDDSPFDARCADALVALASASLAHDADADRASVVVHVDAEALSGGEGSAEIEGAGAIHHQTLRRLVCDGRLELVVEGRGGTPVGVGRRTRSVPPWLLRRLRRRDLSCRFPGCGRTRWLQAHHQKHWVAGGPPTPANLALLCLFHHRLFHEGRWRLEGDPDGELAFIRPSGWALEHGPPALRPEARRLVMVGSA